MSDQLTWEQRVNKLKIISTFPFHPDFDLVKHFRELPLCTESRAKLREEFKEESDKLVDRKKASSKKIRALEKALAQLSPTNNQTVITTIENEIEKSKDDVSWDVITPQRYSKSKMYISRLCGIFYEGTGILPEVKAPKVKGKSPYRGNFYGFLLVAKPLLEEIGIELGDNHTTIGDYAYQIVNGNKKEGIISFAKLINEMKRTSRYRIKKHRG